MNFIKKEIRKCDLLAARYYKLAEGDRERAARDWYDQVKKVADIINIPPRREKKEKKK